MDYKITYSKDEAIDKAKEFLAKVNALEDEYAMSFNSDTGDVYLTFQTSDKDKHWDNIKLGWDGDGTGLKVKSKKKLDKVQAALAKLSDEDKKALNLK